MSPSEWPYCPCSAISPVCSLSTSQLHLLHHVAHLYTGSSYASWSVMVTTFDTQTQVCSCTGSLLLVCELLEPEFEYEFPPFELEDCVELDVLSPPVDDVSSDELDVSSSSSVEESSVLDVVSAFFVDLFVCVVVVVVVVGSDAL